MLTLPQLKSKVQVLSEKGFKIPEIPRQIQDRVNSYKELNLAIHYRNLAIKARNQQALDAGFVKITPEEVVRLMHKDNINKIANHGGGWYTPEHFYKHPDDKRFPSIYLPEIHVNPGWIWSDKVYAGFPLDDLKTEIPYGVLLRIAELKNLEFFNCFICWAPIELRNSVPLKAMDPVVTACLTSYDSRDADHYFVASWE